MKDFFVLYLMYFSAADALSQREFRALEDDNASFLMLYAKCNTCSSISSFRKFNFKYASSEVDYFYEKVVKWALPNIYNHFCHRSERQRDKNVPFFGRHMLSTLCHMTMIEGAREEKTSISSLYVFATAECMYQSFIGQEGGGPIC